MRLQILQLPHEVLTHPYWAMSTMQKDYLTEKPDKSPRNAYSKERISVTDPASWLPFAEVINTHPVLPAQMGFCLTTDDTLMVIDMDRKPGITKEELAVQERILKMFPSYTEWSVSGTGLHIILRGKIGGGIRRGSVEIYDQERYILCTGDVMTPGPILDADKELLATLIAEMGGLADDDEDQEDDGEQTFSDDLILHKLHAAKNHEKFRDLFYRVPASAEDWSQRDASLAQMIVFYTDNKEQAIRVFMQSKLYRPHGKSGQTPRQYEEGYLRKQTFPTAFRHERKRRAAKLPPPVLESDIVAREDPEDMFGHFDAPTLPPGLLPDVIERFARTKGALMGVDPSGVATSSLAICAVATSDYVKVKMKRHDSWSEPARLWIALVGPPSVKKSPSLNAAEAPLVNFDKRLRHAHVEARRAYLGLSKDEKANTAEPQLGTPRLANATVEAAGQVMQYWPHGVGVVQDELTAWIGGMEKYNGPKGGLANRAFWLQSHNGGYYSFDRITRESGSAENIGTSIVGGIQPDVIRKIAQEATDDGLIQRFVPIILLPAVESMDVEMPDVETEYDRLVMSLFNIQPRAALLQFDDEAQAIRAELERKHLRLQSLEVMSAQLASHIGKYDGLFGRLCVLWHCIETQDQGRVADVISGDVARRVAAFMNDFLLPHAIKFYAEIIGLGARDSRVKDVADFILAHPEHKVLNVALLQKSVRSLRDLDKREAITVMQILSAYGWAWEEPGPATRSDPVFRRNPILDVKYAMRAGREKTRLEQVKKAMAESFEARRSGGNGGKANG